MRIHVVYQTSSQNIEGICEQLFKAPDRTTLALDRSWCFFDPSPGNAALLYYRVHVVGGINIYYEPSCDLQEGGSLFGHYVRPRKPVAKNEEFAGGSYFFTSLRAFLKGGCVRRQVFDCEGQVICLMKPFKQIHIKPARKCCETHPSFISAPYQPF